MEYLNAFLCGGLLCAVGQIILDRTNLTPARILTGYVVAGVFLQAVGVYQYVVDWGGAGATVPLTGFGYSLAKEMCIRDRPCPAARPTAALPDPTGSRPAPPAH